MTLRVGVVGAGMIAAIHAEAIRRTEGTELAGVWDRGSGRGAEIAPECQSLSTPGASLAQFVARDDLDAITVASPSGAHLEAALLAAEGGKHCLVEKPLEITVERIDRMIDAHRRSGTVLAGIFNTRYTEGARLLREARLAGRFGRLTYLCATCPWWREQSYYSSSDWKGTWALDGGGALMNQGIHSIDLLQWLANEPVVAVSGQIATLAHDGVEVEDTGVAHLKFASGALGTVACTTSVWPGHFRTITVAGTDGSAVLADGNLLEWQFRKERDEDAEIRANLLSLPGDGVGAANPSAGVDAAGHAAVLADFADAVARGRAPAVDGLEARKAVALIAAIYASSRQGGQLMEP
ncbi:MAG: Gfo/Idh/MocA family oxidoreductase [Pseudomonadota bacterium]